MPSFDVVTEVDKVELKNAVDQANKEISNRFDFKGSNARIELSDGQEITVYADDDFKMSQVYDVMIGKMAKRQIDTRILTKEKIEKISGDKVKQTISVLSGMEGTWIYSCDCHFRKLYIRLCSTRSYSCYNGERCLTY